MTAGLALRIVIFAKAPLPGLAKTRLSPALGTLGAAQLAEKLLRHTISEALAAAVGTVELCVTPASTHPCWSRLALPAGLQWSDQGAGDLGERLARASQRVTQQGESLLFMGSDCPGLSAQRLREAAEALQHHDSCLVPASDGGYVLLGLRSHLASVFADMPWSSAAVGALTLERIRAAGLSCQQLAVLHDIDEPADLAWLPASLRA